MPEQFLFTKEKGSLFNVKIWIKLLVKKSTSCYGNENKNRNFLKKIKNTGSNKILTDGRNKMEYRKFDNVIIARIDKGEEILEQLKAIAINENIKLASINALGAINDFTIGVYKIDEKKYYSNSFKGYYEITSLTGTINTMDGEYYAHLHMSVGNEKGEAFGGHLNRAVVSATCEMVITVIDGKVDRVYDEETGLNVFKFANFPFEKEVLKKAGKKDIIATKNIGKTL